ncbi:MAG: hypothetical protein QOF39_2549 [Frankiales bacterium]|nr:hypothetical protein [Frankiales bacterium]
MVPERVARRLGIPVLTVATVAVLITRCAGSPPVATGHAAAAVPTASRTAPACAGCGPTAQTTATSGLAGKPDVVAPPGSGVLFAGRDLIYATHGFSTAEVAALARRVPGPVTAVFSSEQMVASRVAGFPDIAVDTLIADPVSYAAAVGVPDLAGLLRAGVVLATGEAQLRKVGVGGRIAYTDGTSLPVTAVVDAHEIGGHEMATALGVRPLASGATAGYLLVGGASTVAALTTVAHAVWPTRTIRVKDHTANGYMSGADTVLTQLQTKLDFGEFTSRPAGVDTFVPDPAWIKNHLTSRRIVQLGDVTCNTAIINDLTAAMQEVTARGLGGLIDTADFQYEGGCWNPRAARAISGGTLSIHSWGAAIDINVKNNPLGGAPHQDPRLVAIMAAHGFAWGGRFLRPDGGHFQWVGDSIPH